MAERGQPSTPPGENSVDAEHALLVVRQKLNGRVGSAVLSVEGQVRLLVSQAMDENNLAHMYPGWSPWL
jgi:phosphatidylinositol kinase/protein kinase (PI-3  family)